MNRLTGKLAAAASALVLAINLFGLNAYAETKKSKDKKDDSSVSETEKSNDSKSDKKKDKDKNKDKDSSSEEEQEPEEEIDPEAAEREKENFHRSGAWGYTMLPDNTVSISKYYGDSVHPAVPSTIDGFDVTAISGGWYTDESGNILIYGNIHNITFDETNMISGSSVYSPFSGNKAIVEVTIPDSVKYIGAIAFKGCKKLQKVNFGSGVQVIGNNCFEDCAALETIAVPASVTYVDLKAFSGCTALTAASLPNAHLEPYIFENCTALTSVTLGKTDSIPQFMFSGCTALAEIAVPSGTEKICDSAFEGCTALKAASLPDSLKEIHNNSFAGCVSLDSVQMSSNIEAIGNNAFADCPIQKLVLPDTLTKIGKAAFGMTADGRPVESFKLLCSELSPARSYAENNGLTFEIVNGELPKVTVSTAETPLDDSSQGGPGDVLDSDLMYKLLLVIIGVTSVSIVAAIILIIKNHKLGDTPESEDYFPSDDFDEEQDLDAAEYDRYSENDMNYPADGYAEGGYPGGSYPADGYTDGSYPADGYGYSEDYDEYNDLDAFDDLGSKGYSGGGSADNYFEPGRDIYRPGNDDGGYSYRPEDFMPKDPNGK